MATKAGRPLFDLIKLCVRSKQSVLLRGPHGIGKSVIGKQTAEELGIDFISRDLSLMEPPDLIGLPVVDGEVTRYRPPAFLPTAGEGLLVFEELNRCRSDMRAPCLQLLSERRLNDYVLPPGWLPAAAINPSGAGYEVSELDLALTSRFVVADVEPDWQEWLAWARGAGLHRTVIGYVESDPGVFSDPQSNPRAWEYVSNLLRGAKKAECPPATLRQALAGVIGPARSAAFLCFRQHKDRPLDPLETLLRYPEVRPRLVSWVAGGKLDLVQTSWAFLEKYFARAEAVRTVKSNRARRANLLAFLADLPGDLREKAERFFARRGFPIKWPKKGAKKS